MKVQSVGSFNGLVASRNSIQRLHNNQEQRIKQYPSFGNVDGRIIGGSIGGGVGAFGALFALCSGPIGLLTIGAMAIVGASGAAIGSEIGDAISGKDKK